MVQNIIIFDLDETLGYFTEIGIFWEIINCYYENKKEIDLFNLIDMFPQFLRPNIIKILEYIKIQKEDGRCDMVIVYTNNKGPSQWYKLLTKYFNNKLKFKLFDKIIGPYNISNCRTSNNKKYKDILNCLHISKETNICFIDNRIHNEMINNKVYYIHIKSYKNEINFKNMLNIYLKDEKNIDLKNNFIKFATFKFDKYKYIYDKSLTKNKDIENEYKISELLFYHIKFFFKETSISS